MGKLMLEARVAGGVNSRIARLQEIVDAHAGDRVAVNTRSFQVESLDVWQAAGAGQDGVDRNRAFVVVADEIDKLLTVFNAHPDRRGIEPHLDAVAREGIRQNL